MLDSTCIVGPFTPERSRSASAYVAVVGTTNCSSAHNIIKPRNFRRGVMDAKLEGHAVRSKQRSADYSVNSGSAASAAPRWRSMVTRSSQSPLRRHGCCGSIRDHAATSRARTPRVISSNRAASLIRSQSYGNGERRHRPSTLRNTNHERPLCRATSQLTKPATLRSNVERCVFPCFADGLGDSGRVGSFSSTLPRAHEAVDSGGAGIVISTSTCGSTPEVPTQFLPC